MKKFSSALVKFLKSEDGPTAVEYAVMLALIIVVCIAAITTLGTNAKTPSPRSAPRSPVPKGIGVGKMGNGEWGTNDNQTSLSFPISRSSFSLVFNPLMR